MPARTMFACSSARNRPRTPPSMAIASSPRRSSRSDSATGSSAGSRGSGGDDAGGTTESKALRAWSGDRGPADWGIGDGQAVPWEYAPAPESRDVVAIKPRYGLFIDGREVNASDGGWFKSV